mmetsp:Transcript_34973/g.90827  ORF Transcript_34973/g.90827 Transcript_34973/m.90827 type:complete len:215 (+) Transcript_34973:93-737(+)
MAAATPARVRASTGVTGPSSQGCGAGQLARRRHHARAAAMSCSCRMAAHPSSLASASRGPISCTPMGSEPSSATGMLMAGSPAREAGTVMTSVAYICAGLSSAASATLGATSGATGVSSTSTSAKASAKSLATSRRMRCALRKYPSACSLDSAKVPIMMRRSTSGPKPSVRLAVMAALLAESLLCGSAPPSAWCPKRRPSYRDRLEEASAGERT